jgi:hypothetical protein
MKGEHWIIVRRSRTIPGGYRVVRTRLTEDVATRLAAEYKRPHEAMAFRALVELRMAALAAARSVDDGGRMTLKELRECVIAEALAWIEWGGGTVDGFIAGEPVPSACLGHGTGGPNRPWIYCDRREAYGHRTRPVGGGNEQERKAGAEVWVTWVEIRRELRAERWRQIMFPACSVDDNDERDEPMSEPRLRNQDALMLDAMRAEQERDHRARAQRRQHVGATAPVEFSIHSLARLAPRGVGLRRDGGPGHSDSALRSIARRLVAAGYLDEHYGHRMLLWTLVKPSRDDNDEGTNR